MVMQAWGQYGIAWPVIHQQLGVRPSLGTGRLESCRRCRTASPASPGATSASVTAPSTCGPRAASTTVTVRTRLRELNLGLTLQPPAAARDARRPAVRKPDVRLTNRGFEVTVNAPPYGRHYNSRADTAPVWNATSTSFARLALCGRSSTPSRS